MIRGQQADSTDNLIVTPSQDSCMHEIADILPQIGLELGITLQTLQTLSQKSAYLTSKFEMVLALLAFSLTHRSSGIPSAGSRQGQDTKRCSACESLARHLHGENMKSCSHKARLCPRQAQTCRASSVCAYRAGCTWSASLGGGLGIRDSLIVGRSKQANARSGVFESILSKK